MLCVGVGVRGVSGTVGEQVQSPGGTCLNIDREGSRTYVGSEEEEERGGREEGVGGRRGRGERGKEKEIGGRTLYIGVKHD